MVTQSIAYVANDGTIYADRVDAATHDFLARLRETFSQPCIVEIKENLVKLEGLIEQYNTDKAPTATKATSYE